MGERFYLAQLQATGSCPGKLKTNRRKNMAWTDEKKNQACDLYEAANPNPDNTIEIINNIAEELEESPNGVRMILNKAGIYIKKTPAATPSKGATGDKPASKPRIGKEDAINKLAAKIEDVMGVEADREIIGKLTGKAANYFNELLSIKKS